MIYDLFSYITFGIIISEILFLTFDLEVNLSKKDSIVLCFSNLFFVCLFHYLPMCNDIFTYALMGINICITFKENKLKTLGIYTFTCICIYQLKLFATLIVFSFSYKTGISINYLLLNCLVNIFILIIFTAYYRFFKKKWDIGLKWIKRPKYKYFIIIEILILIINVALVSSCYVFIKNNNDLDENLAYNTISSVLSFILVFLGFFINQLILQNSKCKETIKMNNRYISQQKIYYENMIQYQENIKKIEHDIKFHLFTIQAFLSNNEYENANTYIEKLLNNVNLHKSVALFGNIILDSIFNEYKRLIEDNHINVNLHGKYPQDLKIDNYSLCIIFSNLLLNAIEACIAINIKQERYINIELESHGRFLHMTIKNSYQSILPNLKTIKKDTRNHGLGLQNIKACVENNNGNIEISYDKNNFCVSVILQGDYDCE